MVSVTAPPRRRVLCSIGAARHAQLLEITLGTFARYSRTHGYALHVEWNDIGQGRPAAWGKIRLVQSLLQSFDEVLWIDADAAVVRFDADISREVPSGVDLALARDHHARMDLPNTGVMLWRRTSDSLRLLDAAWEQTHLIDHPYWEQAALLELMGYDVRDLHDVQMIAPTVWHRGVHYLGDEWNATFRTAAERPRIIHCAGLRFEQRVQRLTDAVSAALETEEEAVPAS
jgi:nucleotide-diphospho-sugar transferase